MTGTEGSMSEPFKCDECGEWMWGTYCAACGWQVPTEAMTPTQPPAPTEATARTMTSWQVAHRHGTTTVHIGDRFWIDGPPDELWEVSGPPVEMESDYGGGEFPSFPCKQITGDPTLYLADRKENGEIDMCGEAVAEAIWRVSMTTPESTDPGAAAQWNPSALGDQDILDELEIAIRGEWWDRASELRAELAFRLRQTRQVAAIAPTGPGRDKIVMEFSEPTLSDFVNRDDRDGLFRFVQYATADHRYRVAAAERAVSGGA